MNLFWHDQLPSIAYWPMGSLASAQLSQLGWIAILVAGLIALPWRLRRVLDVMPMEDAEVRALEVPIGPALRHDPSGHASLGTGSLGGRHDRLSWADLLSAQKVASNLSCTNTRASGTGYQASYGQSSVLIECLAGTCRPVRSVTTEAVAK